MLAHSTNDIFNSENSSVIVNADVIEAVKENIQPLQKGRRATALSAIFSTPLAQRDAILSRQRARFRLQVVQALEDLEEEEEEVSMDPLDVYSRFVAWTLESYPQGQSAESGLLELLEEATRKLKDIERYKQDPRYLKLWSLYAGYIEKPSMIYSYLLANEIGTNLPELYEECAYVNERDGRRREADEMYRLGIARKVKPLERLTARYADFQRRMVAAPLPDTASPPRPTSLPRIEQRTVLGVSAFSQSSLPVSARTQEAFSTPQPNARLQIFVDPIGGGAQREEGNNWPDVGTRVTRTKENSVEVHKMAHSHLSSRRPAQRSVSGSSSRIVPFQDAPARSTFVPYKDEDDASAMPPPVAPAPSRRSASASRIEPFRDEAPATPGPSFKPYKDESAQPTPARTRVVPTPTNLAPRPKQGALTSEAEALRRDPFKNYDAPFEDM